MYRIQQENETNKIATILWIKNFLFTTVTCLVTGCMKTLLLQQPLQRSHFHKAAV